MDHLYIIIIICKYLHIICLTSVMGRGLTPPEHAPVVDIFIIIIIIRCAEDIFHCELRFFELSRHTVYDICMYNVKYYTHTTAVG